VSFREEADEFDELAKHFNQLLEENERLIAQVREVTDDIAHDLRTPLARIRQDLEASLARPRSGAEDRQVLQRSLEAIDGLLETFHALLSIAQIESGAVNASMAPVDLSAIARDAVDLYAPAAEQAGLALELDAEPSVTVRGNRHLLSQALSNLIDNAIKFSPPPGAIEVGVRTTRTGPEFSVADHGPGVPEHERERVLQRFVRLDSARERPGTGLGLSLVAAVVKLHGASLSFADNAPGLVVTVRFEPDGAG
jgi:signal transduction histidine kinase